MQTHATLVIYIGTYLYNPTAVWSHLRSGVWEKYFKDIIL